MKTPYAPQITQVKKDESLQKHPLGGMLLNRCYYNIQEIIIVSYKSFEKFLKNTCEMGFIKAFMKHF